MAEDEATRIPLHGKAGKGLYALVDGDYDGEYFSQYRWYLLKNGYVGRVEVEVPCKERKGYIYLHQEVGKPNNGLWVDHINRNKLDNRTSNIRLVTPSENALNRVQVFSKENSSGYIGVTAPRYRGKNSDKLPTGGFQTSFGGKYIGTFSTALEAAHAYDKVAREKYGRLAKTNFS